MNLPRRVEWGRQQGSDVRGRKKEEERERDREGREKEFEDRKKKEKKKKSQSTLGEGVTQSGNHNALPARQSW